MDTTQNLCRCGCGTPTPNKFAPGHDSIALHERIKKVGTIADFIEWFDAHYEG